MAVKSHGSPLVLPALAAMSAVILAGGLSACSSGDRAYYANCVDPRSGRVVDPADCHGSSNYYVWMAPQSYSRGYLVPAGARSGAGWFSSSDATARTRAGLPATGDLPRGFSVVSSSGGFDGAHAGSGAHGGDDGGAGHGTGGG